MARENELVTCKDSLAPCRKRNPRQSWILDSGFRISGTEFQFLPVELGFWIAIVSRIPDSLSCIPAQAHSRYRTRFQASSGNSDSANWPGY